MTAAMRQIVDDDGENRAVRSFLMAYSADRAITVDAMREHMDLSGWPAEYCPPFARAGSAHLTKAGAQMWLRYLFGLERAAPEPIAADADAIVAQALDVINAARARRHARELAERSGSRRWTDRED